jgi:hypothetical protein
MEHVHSASQTRSNAPVPKTVVRQVTPPPVPATMPIDSIPHRRASNRSRTTSTSGVPMFSPSASANSSPAHPRPGVAAASASPYQPVTDELRIEIATAVRHRAMSLEAAAAAYGMPVTRATLICRAMILPVAAGGCSDLCVCISPAECRGASHHPGTVDRRVPDQDQDLQRTPKRLKRAVKEETKETVDEEDDAVVTDERKLSFARKLTRLFRAKRWEHAPIENCVEIVNAIMLKDGEVDFTPSQVSFVLQQLVAENVIKIDKASSSITLIVPV